MKKSKDSIFSSQKIVVKVLFSNSIFLDFTSLIIFRLYSMKLYSVSCFNEACCVEIASLIKKL